MTHDEVKRLVKSHVAQQFLAGEDPDSLTDDVKLVSDGIVDSLATLRLVAWLEERFGVKIESHEVDSDHLDTLDQISAMVVSKRA